MMRIHSSVPRKRRTRAVFSLSMSILLLLVLLPQPTDGKWYAQICPTGSVEAVTLDKATGQLIFVEYGSSTTNNGNNDNTTTTTEDDNSNSTGAPSKILIDDIFNSSSQGTSPSSNNPGEVSIGGGSRYLRSRNDDSIMLSWLQPSDFTVTPAWKTSSTEYPNEQKQQRLLESFVLEVVDYDGENKSESSSSSSSSSSPLDELQDGEIFYIRPCLCYNGANRYSSSSSSSPDGTTTSASSSTAEELYLCHAEATYCGVPVEYSDEKEYNTNNHHVESVACYSVNMQQVVARNAWPLILLWYFGLLVICACTIHGHTASEYIKSCFLPHHNERFLNRILDDNNNNMNNPRSRLNWRSWQRHRFESNLMLQVQWLWRHEEYQRERYLRRRGIPPPQLELKVKRWTNQQHNNNKNNDRNNDDDLYSNQRNDVEDDVSMDNNTDVRLQFDNSNNGKDSAQCPEHDDELGQGKEAIVDLSDVVDDNGGNDLGSTAASPISNDDREGHGNNGEDDVDSNSLEEPSCTICFAPLEEGDRIGDLQCNHEFHVDCLKTWIQRKNACPLCNVPIGNRRSRRRHTNSHNEQEDGDDSVSSFGDGDEYETYRGRDGRRRLRPRFGSSFSSRLSGMDRQIGVIGVMMSAQGQGRNVAVESEQDHLDSASSSSSSSDHGSNRSSGGSDDGNDNHQPVNQS